MIATTGGSEAMSKRKPRSADLIEIEGEDALDAEGLPPFIQVQIKPKALIRDFELFRKSQIVAPSRVAIAELAIMKFLDSVGALSEESKRIMEKKFGKRS